jgi:hypothetical protein
MDSDKVKESTPLQWPDGWPRTRLQDRESKSAWKKNYADSVQGLLRELSRLGATACLITHNDRHSEDSGVSVYFSLKPLDNYGWQEALGFIGEVPTVQQIDRAYMERVKRIHPDGPTPDLVLFRSLTEHRDRARSWARGEQRVEHEKVIPCDAFREARWNVNAIRLTIAAMRQIERCGSPMMMERAFRGFSKALITAGGTSDTAA